MLGEPAIWSNLGVSFVTIAAGVLLALVTSFVLDATARQRAGLRKFLQAVSSVLAAVPVVGMFPLLVVALGFGTASHVAMVSLIAIFPMLDAMSRGAAPRPSHRSVYTGPARATAQLEAIPEGSNLVPSRIFAALRAGTPFAITGVLVAEFLASNSGAGYLLVTATSQLDMDTAWATFVLLSVAAVLTLGVFKDAEHRFAS
ncbi:MAG TPA: hypothetical protein VF601_15500 [Beijerinckiaceae bacterium]|jgi:NitT/TauT family transport system permease protein